MGSLTFLDTKQKSHQSDYELWSKDPVDSGSVPVKKSPKQRSTFMCQKGGMSDKQVAEL